MTDYMYPSAEARQIWDGQPQQEQATEPNSGEFTNIVIQMLLAPIQTSNSSLDPRDTLSEQTSCSNHILCWIFIYIYFIFYIDILHFIYKPKLQVSSLMVGGTYMQLDPTQHENLACFQHCTKGQTVCLECNRASQKEEADLFG